ncbi:CPBP family intramembrane glutamic endopeptidase [Leucobacter luti]|uniref:CAAX prenyl protease-like protein n=1 Tax=Leucobacter luti TaxID=340320 RepID=A0A4Q7U942_9MICO|nr:CPBP family intramembrane glutamic endopeptidase [Leucobacter luti]RZT68782.1 CAAX prenyl protease-like protein [Leucobacter luti]
MSEYAEHAEPSAWRRFWNAGGWWRSLLLVVAYYALYQLGGILVLPLATGVTDPGLQVLILTGLPILLGGVILVAFALSIGWLRELFGRQPIRGRGWMWIAVAAVLLFNALRFATIDYTAAGAGVVVAWLVTGLFIGFAEEVLTRGFVVTLMRRAGYREIAVALVSAAVFAALHSGNILDGQGLLTTAVQVFYTFALGICMYLALRVTGNLVWPILLHATTDPSIFLQTSDPAAGALTAFAGLGNFAVIAVGLVLLCFIRGRVQPVPDFSGTGAFRG